jgi:hypothetical protein
MPDREWCFKVDNVPHRLLAENALIENPMVLVMTTGNASQFRPIKTFDPDTLTGTVTYPWSQVDENTAFHIVEFVDRTPTPEEYDG